MHSKKIMAVGAHADDIEFNAGGTLLKYHAAGYEIVYVLSTNNMAGMWSSLDTDGTRVSKAVPWHVLQPERKREAENAAKIFGTRPVHLNHPQRHYWNDALEKVELRYGEPRPECVPENTPSILTASEDPVSVSALAELIARENPETVLTHDPIQRDIEHFATYLLVSRAVAEAGFRGTFLLWPAIDEPWCGEIYNSRQTWIDISAWYEKKLEALRIHSCQIPTTRNFTFRPWEKGTGCRHVEAFAAVRLSGEEGEFTQEIRKHVSN